MRAKNQPKIKPVDAKKKRRVNDVSFMTQAPIEDEEEEEIASPSFPVPGRKSPTKSKGGKNSDLK